MNDEIDRAVYETRALLSERQTPDFRAAVMSRIENLEPLTATHRRGLVGRLAHLMWEPREISIRPAFALASAAAIVLVLALPYARPSQSGVPTVASTASEPGEQNVFVQFHLETMAMRVQLAGSFTNWEPRYDLHQSAPGVWTITVPLTQGVHDYAFIVDGEQWVPDPHAPQIGDGFGGTNSRLALLSPNTPQL